MTIYLPRRRFLTVAASLLAAPAIVRASSLMPIKAVDFGACDFSTENMIVKMTERYSWMYELQTGFNLTREIMDVRGAT